MSWVGKMVGGTIGFALGGPVGAVLGGVFGHAFDTSEERHLPGGRTLLSPEEETQMTFFVAGFSMLAKLAAADGRITQKEIDTVQQFMAHDLSMTENNRQIAFRIFNQAAGSGNTFEQFARQFYDRFSDKPELLDLMLDILLRISLADGHITPAEENLILSAARIFQYSDAAYSRIKERYVKSSDSVYAVLKSDRADTDEQIKRQYRKLVSEFHPDKIASKGLPEEFTAFAAEKFREIHEAYETIRQERGF